MAAAIPIFETVTTSVVKRGPNPCSSLAPPQIFGDGERPYKNFGGFLGMGMA